MIRFSSGFGVQCGILFAGESGKSCQCFGFGSWYRNQMEGGAFVLLDQDRNPPRFFRGLVVVGGLG